MSQDIPAKGIRIWHQSMTILEDQPGYTELMKEHALRVCDEGTVVDFHGVSPDSNAPETIAFAWPHLLNSLEVVENVIRAEKEGYDAVAMTCFLDPLVDVCRSVVDIPVLVPLETSLLVASTSARAFGLMVTSEPAGKYFRHRSAGYGFENRIALVEASDPPLDDNELEAGFRGDRSLIDPLIEQIKRMVAGGADIVIPAAGVLNAMLVHNDITNVDGVPVLDSFGAVLGTAEMLVKLHRRSSFRNANTGLYRRPSDEQTRHARDVAIRILTEASGRG